MEPQEPYGDLVFMEGMVIMTVRPAEESRGHDEEH